MLPQEEQPEATLKVTHKRTLDEKQGEVVTYLIEHKRRSYKQFKANVLLFFSLGLTISLLSIIFLFEYKSYDRGEQLDIATASTSVDELLDIPITQQPPPPPQQKLQQPNIIAVTEEEIIEEIEVDFDVEMTTEEVIDYDTPMPEMDEPEEEVADEIFTIVEEQPQPKGGLQAFYTYVSEEIKYPSAALHIGIQGKVFVQFVVNSDGSLTDFVVVKGIGSGCDEEAVRVLKNAPKWIPGKQRGQPVRVRMMVPIFFVLKQR
ncbi:MAG: energy transducer TonB [Fulvivirga sp.]